VQGEGQAGQGLREAAFESGGGTCVASRVGGRARCRAQPRRMGVF
jgi:hypothetical protein